MYKLLSHWGPLLRTVAVLAGSPSCLSRPLRDSMGAKGSLAQPFFALGLPVIN